MSNYRAVIHSGRIERGEPTDKVIADDQRFFTSKAEASTWMRERAKAGKCGGKVFEVVETCVDEVVADVYDS